MYLFNCEVKLINKIIFSEMSMRCEMINEVICIRFLVRYITFLSCPVSTVYEEICIRFFVR